MRIILGRSNHLVSPRARRLRSSVVSTSVAEGGAGKPALAPGQVLGGRFTVERQAAEDAIGIVLAARDGKTQKPIALRVLAAAVVPGEKGHKLLREHCRVAATLSHRNIATTYGVGSDPTGGHFVATEWIDGMPLSQLIEKRRQEKKPLSLRGAYNVAAHVCRAIEAAHATTVHGALRPSIVWVSKSGRVKVADWGIGRAICEAAGASALGPQEQACLAPEVRGGKAPTQRSDVFGIGALLYELIAQRPAAEGFVPPSVTHPDATPPLDEVLLRALAADPETRFATPSELRLALLPLVGDNADDPSDSLGVDVEVAIDDAADEEAAAAQARASSFPSALPDLMDDESNGAAAAPAPAPAPAAAAPPTPSEAPISIQPEALSIPPEAISIMPPEPEGGGIVPPPPVGPPMAAPRPPPPVAAAPATANRISGGRPSAADRPQVGQRVSIGEPFRASLAHAPPQPFQPGAASTPSAPGAAASGGAAEEVDLARLLAKITENDAPRWMAVKDGLDHGPFSGRELVGLILKGEVLEEHGLLNMDTGERRKVKQFPEFVEFLEQYKLKKREEEGKIAVAKSQTVEKASNVVKFLIAGAVFCALGLGVAIFFMTRKDAGNDAVANRSLDDLYESGDISDVSVGLLPDPGRSAGGGRRRRSGGPGGGSGGGGGGSYEEAMNQAVDLGDVSQGGGSQATLTGAQVQGVMNQHINSMYQCVTQELGRGGSIQRVQIDVAIASDGRVIGSSARQGSPAFQSCIQSKVRSIRFPSFPAPRMGARYGFAVD